MNFWQKLYKTFITNELNLNDQLAALRSILANERTFLAYQRTALTLAAVGFSLIKFFDELWSDITGWTFLLIALITIILGIIRYRRMRDLIFNLETRLYDRLHAKEEIHD
jgi:putative membrane protein